MATNNQIQSGTSVIPLLGVTSGAAAAAGIIGEVISSQVLEASGVAMTTGNVFNITTLSLLAGDYDILGNVFFSGTAVTNPVSICWISGTSATLPDRSLTSRMVTLLVATNNFVGLPCPYYRALLAAPATIYLSARSDFTAGTMVGSGGIFARRRR